MADEDNAVTIAKWQAHIAGLLASPSASFTEQGRQLALAELRKRPWVREGDLLVWRYELDGAQIEDHWDGESLSIDRVVTPPGALRHLTVAYSIDGDA